MSTERHPFTGETDQGTIRSIGDAVSPIGKWDVTQHPEEWAEKREYWNEPPPYKENLPGGGASALEVLMEDPERSDPELVVMFQEYLDEVFGVETIEDAAYMLSVDKAPRETVLELLSYDFMTWMEQEDDSEIEVKYNTEVALDKEAAGFDYPLLKELWGRKDTHVTYELGHSLGTDRLVFENFDAEGKTRMVELPVPDLFSGLQYSKQAGGGRYPFIPRPVDAEKERRCTRIVKTLTLEGNKFKPEQFEISDTRRTVVEVDKDDFGFIRSGKYKQQVEAWFGMWQDPDRNDIEVIIGANGYTLDTMEMKSGDRRVEFPYWMWERAIGAEKRYVSYNGSKLSGTRLPGSGNAVMPDTSDAKLQEIFDSLYVNGVPGRNRVKVFVNELGPE